MNTPLGVPLVYEFDDSFRLLNVLGDQGPWQLKCLLVANQVRLLVKVGLKCQSFLAYNLAEKSVNLYCEEDSLAETLCTVHDYCLISLYREGISTYFSITNPRLYYRA